MKNTTLISLLLGFNFLSESGCKATKSAKDGDERCNGSSIEYCSMENNACTWNVSTTCTTTQNCTEATSGDSTVATCVNADHTGALCDPDSASQRCVGNAVQYCSGSGSDGTWASYTPCTTSQTCTEYTVADSYGDSYVSALCVNADQTGALCDPSSDSKRCVSNAVQYCEGSGTEGTWASYTPCTTSQTCTEYTVADSYGDSYVSALCVNADQTGALCDSNSDYKRCVENAIQNCSDLGIESTWSSYTKCTTGQTCTEYTLANSSGERYVSALCVNADKTGALCDPKSDNKRCVSNAVQYCPNVGVESTWRSYTECTTTQKCTEASVVDAYGKRSTNAECL